MCKRHYTSISIFQLILVDTTFKFALAKRARHWAQDFSLVQLIGTEWETNEKLNFEPEKSRVELLLREAIFRYWNERWVNVENLNSIHFFSSLHSALSVVAHNFILLFSLWANLNRKFCSPCIWNFRAPRTKLVATNQWKSSIFPSSRGWFLYASGRNNIFHQSRCCQNSTISLCCLIYDFRCLISPSSDAKEEKSSQIKYIQNWRWCVRQWKSRDSFSFRYDDDSKNVTISADRIQSSLAHLICLCSSASVVVRRQSTNLLRLL